MASPASGIVDPTKAGKYRVVLSDDLLGKDPKQLYTGIRYNHRPTPPSQAKIKQSDSSSYDLSFQQDGGRYAYKGTRGQEDGQYVLIFDPDREVFVLHRIDSMFNMNVVRTPSNNDAGSLRQEHKQLEAHRPPRPPKQASKSAAAGKPKKPAAKETRVQKAEPPKPPPAPAKKARDDYEDESSDDDLLTIEDPGGAAPPSHRDFSPGFIEKPRRFSEFVQQQNEEEDDDAEGDEIPDVMDLDDEHGAEAVNDADGEDEEEEEEDDDAFEHFKLPSPINRQMMGNIHASSTAKRQDADDDDEEEMEDVAQDGAANQDDDEMDLEAALMAELDNQESDVSEEE